MENPGRTPRTTLLRTVVRRVVLGAFCCVAAVIVLLVGVVVLSVAGVSSDPHGYVLIVGSVSAVVLGLAAQVLWALYRWLR